jgi:hypothetical protein
MPKPPMKEDVQIFEPTGQTDKYGKPSYTEVPSKARVAYTTKVIETTDGNRYEPSLQVDLPPTAKIGYGFIVQWTDHFGEVVKDSVVAMEETLNYGGDKVYWRTVYVGKERRN